VAAVNQVLAICDISDAVVQATVVGCDGEPLIQDGSDADSMARIVPTGEKAYEGSLVSITDMEAAVVALLAGDTLPGLGDDGGARDVGWLRGEVEKDFTNGVVVIERILSRRQGW
jgi:hypothetical protein